MSDDPTSQQDSALQPAIVIGMYGLMRSGNHAIASWLLDQYPGRVACFLNNADPGTDPYDSCRGWLVRNAPEPRDLPGLRRLQPHCLIYSYEDRRVRDSQERRNFLERAQAGFRVTARRLLGVRAERQFRVGVIRDPFNAFASRLTLLRQRGHCEGESDTRIIAQNWKRMARHALRVGRGMKDNEIVIRYNQWLEDPRYRASISEALAGDSRLDLPRSVPHFGGGSSFQPVPALSWGDVLANPRKVLSLDRWRRAPHYLRRLAASRPKSEELTGRWRRLQHDEEFRRLFADPEIWRLAEELFGKMPGSSALKGAPA
jgi:hypothetical protein